MTGHIGDEVEIEYDDVDSWPKDIKEAFTAIKAAIDDLPTGDPLKAPAEQGLRTLVTELEAMAETIDVMSDDETLAAIAAAKNESGGIDENEVRRRYLR